MSKLIDVNEAIINFGFEWDDIPPTREEFVRFLKKQPTVDAVAVVRCRECKCYKDASVTEYEHCCLTGQIVGDDDFCSYGEKRRDKDGTT